MFWSKLQDDDDDDDDQWRRLHGARGHVPPLLQMAWQGGHRE